MVTVIARFGNGAWQPQAAILAMALPKVVLNHHLCFTSSWLPVPSPSHGEADSAHSCWLHFSVKSPSVPKPMRAQEHHGSMEDSGTLLQHKQENISGGLQSIAVLAKCVFL